jgi:hypothetical protein
MDLERRVFSRRVAAAVRRVAVIYPEMNDLALEALDFALRPIFVEWYGRFPGDPEARFYRLILQETGRAVSLVAQREREHVTKKLLPYPQLLEAVSKNDG